MGNHFTYLPYKETRYFSRLVTDYLDGSPDLEAFYRHQPNGDGIEQAIVERAKFGVNRESLVNVLAEQYEPLTKYSQAEENIQSLRSENTFTVCTAHQPNLLTGYLYFVYKILHAIKLAEQLNERYNDKHFVPVYYMGSEDNDIEELGTFLFRGEKYVWDGDGQAGAVGRMNTNGLKSILEKLFKVFGPPGSNCDELEKLITTTYLKHSTIASATQYLVNELFGRYGLIVLNPDNAALKRAFIPVMEDELLHQNAIGVITKQIESLGKLYKIQAHPRSINLFYLNDQLRERIEKKEDKWIVVNTETQWTEAQLIAELHEHPERFSPNVMLRGLYQETILPNIAFIGGGAEVAYWMQLRTLFENYSVFFPVILLRQSVLWMTPKAAELQAKLALTMIDIFKQEQELVREYMLSHSSNEWQTADEARDIAHLFENVKNKAVAIDATLAASAEAVKTKIMYQLAVMEKKMLRAEKKQMQTELSRITRLKTSLFPANSLQERVENFAEYYLEYGPSFFDTIKEGIEPLDGQFLIVEAT